MNMAVRSPWPTFVRKYKLSDRTVHAHGESNPIVEQVNQTVFRVATVTDSYVYIRVSRDRRKFRKR